MLIVFQNVSIVDVHVKGRGRGVERERGGGRERFKGKAGSIKLIMSCHNL